MYKEVQARQAAGGNQYEFQRICYISWPRQCVLLPVYHAGRKLHHRYGKHISKLSRTAEPIKYD